MVIDILSERFVADPFLYSGHAINSQWVTIKPFDKKGIVSFEDIKYIYANPALFLSEAMGNYFSSIRKEAENPFGKPLVSLDGEDHTRLRKILTTAIHQKKWEETEPYFHAIIRKYLEKHRGREIDIVFDFFEPIFYEVTAVQLGLDSTGDKKIVDLARSYTDRASERSTLQGKTQKQAGFRNLILNELNNPYNDSPFILQIKKIIHKGKIREREAADLLIFTFFAATETSIRFFPILFYHLLKSNEHPESILKNISNYLNESLRLYSPSLVALRKTSDNTILPSGIGLLKDEIIFIMNYMGNRCPQKFPNPNTFDPNRKNSNIHFGLGGGVHRCIGFTQLKNYFAALLNTLYPNGESSIHFQTALRFRPSMFLRSPHNVIVKIK